MKIQYTTGDATNPLISDGPKFILHIVNDINAWGAGFVVAISKRWPRPEQEYHAWMTRNKDRNMLGAVQVVPVEKGLAVVNLVGQHGIYRSNQGPPIRYEAVAHGCHSLAERLAEKFPNASIHAPRLGCGLAGGSWARIEPILEESFIARNIPVVIYDFPGAKFNS